MIHAVALWWRRPVTRFSYSFIPDEPPPAPGEAKVKITFSFAKSGSAETDQVPTEVPTAVQEAERLARPESGPRLRCEAIESEPGFAGVRRMRSAQIVGIELAGLC